ncbi:MAG: heme ABC exporter ATP-binding protein CcmA [Betaproteobacteria bacterium AqS2]|uniref:Heme ABC exporter ATP-binding protein CcmA n=1 Tax=Candidatus Amphirhobacter heronislandensis TaxID=1732024 RepID=A0A930UE18_9GAMM|nr:heme ABC exporter ATP-binding protein CcmA [Betaproteobacteria bacterium AqS2]
MLALRAASLDRGGRRLFAGVELRLEPGRLYVATGGNGAGKTSLLKLMAGLLEPDAGAVEWDGVELAEAGGGYRGALMLLGHKHGLKLDLTAVENLELAQALAGGRPLLDPAAACAKLGLDEAACAQPCRRLSAGQLRRAGLARLLLNEARLWLLDEPFANLDAAGRATLRQLLAEHLGRGGTAALTTHVEMDWGDLAAERIELAALAAADGGDA